MYYISLDIDSKKWAGNTVAMDIVLPAKDITILSKAGNPLARDRALKKWDIAIISRDIAIIS